MTTDPTAQTADPVCKFDEGCHRVVPCKPGCGASAAVSVPPPADQTALRQRIAAALYEHLHPGSHWSDTSMPSDWRPTYLEEAAAVLAVLPEQADRAALLRAADIAEDVAESLRKHHEFERSTGALDVMTELRRVAAEEQPTETQARPPLHEWFVETRMLDGRWSKYGASRDTAEDGRELFERDITGSGKGHAFRLVRAITTYVVEAEHTPPTAQPAVGEQPTETPMFGSPDCTCIPFTQQGGKPRYCGPTDTVDMISGWEIGRDCPHHKPAVGEQPETRVATLHAIPLPGSNGISSCCGRPPCEFVGERVTRNPDEVTCRGPE